jgi:NAD+ synthase (glutamine-hydrolysing)
MLPIHFAVGVLNQTPLDWSGNLRRIRGAIADARAAGASVVCLPELGVSAYGCEDAFHSRAVTDKAWDNLLALLPDTQGLVVTVGVPVRHRGAAYNCAAVMVDGRLVGLVAKQHLAGDGIHYEPRWFKPWPAGKQAKIRDARVGEVPIGDLYFDIGGLRVGFEICEDAWVASRPGASLAARALDVLCNPSASHFAFGKLPVRRRLILEGSRAFGVTYLYANLLGNEAGRVVYDGGAQIATGGELVAAGPRLGMEEWSVVTAVVDVERTRTQQARTASFRPGVEDGGDACVHVAFDVPKAAYALPTPAVAAWETSAQVKEEELARAVTLGLFDYLRKSRSRGFVVSLSGGADSAACAALVHLMVRRGLAELGGAAFAARIGLVTEPTDDARALTGRLLTCVYQATAQSSETTRNAAKTVADAVGARWAHFDVEPIVQAYMGLVSDAIGRPLDWDRDDIPLQNIQARVRAPGAWMLANLAGALLLTTSNRSEAAVGYATMDGDTAGGLAPLGGIDKAFLRRWLRWLEAEGPAGLGPIPALRVVNVQAPTAELRPAAEHQTDEDDLMPYPVLDAIERAAIRDKRGPAEVLAVLQAERPGHDRAELVRWVRRFFTLWCQNQWKRERYAPSFHLDDESLDPRTWCRFPILSGGYAEELAALETP